MSLGRKLLSGFASMLALVLLTSGGALLVTRSLNDDLERAADVTARKQYLAGEVSAATAEMAGSEQGTVLAEMLSDKAHSAQYQQTFRARAAALQKALDELSQLAEGGETESIVKNLKQQASMVLQEHEELSQSVATDKMDAALGIFSQKVQPRIDDIGKAASSLVDQQSRELAAASAASASKSSRTTAATVTLTLLALGVGVGVFVIVRQANGSLKIYRRKSPKARLTWLTLPSRCPPPANRWRRAHRSRPLRSKRHRRPRKKSSRSRGEMPIMRRKWRRSCRKPARIRANPTARSIAWWSR
jgi:CHASE3 domain sensor protein